MSEAERRTFLDAWFIHPTLVMTVVGDDRATQITREMRQIRESGALSAFVEHRITVELQRHIAAHPIRELVPLLNSGSLREGDLTRILPQPSVQT